MRTARSVMVLIVLFLASAAGFGQGAPTRAQDSVDTIMTIVGRDEADLPLPPPWRQQTVSVPDFSPWQPPVIYVPPVQPPVGDFNGTGTALPDPLADIGI